MVGGDDHRDRLIDVLLREQVGAEQPPDLEDGILARASPSRRRRWASAATAMAAAAAILLIVASVVTVAPKSSTVGRKSPLPAARDPASLPPPVQVTTGAASRRLISATVRVPVRSVKPFRIPDTAPIPTGRVRIPSFSVRLPQTVTLFTTKSKKRSPS